MSEKLTQGIVRILDSKKNIVGTGFVVSEAGLIATCSHVIQPEPSQRRKDPRPEKLSVIFQATGGRREAYVIADWWRTIDEGDIAFLQVEGDLPDKVHPLPLGSSAGTNDHEIQVFGFPDVGKVEGVWGKGQVLGSVTEIGLSLLQLKSSEITVGFSGAPVWNKARRRVIGMVVEITRPDLYHRFPDTAFAVPAETLQAVCPALQMSEVCPYRGLDVFTEAYAEFFFGRKRVIDRLVNRLINGPQFLAVFGPSGSGKSSTVQAGLIPQLRQGAVKGSDYWGFVVSRPADDPFKQLIKGFNTTSQGLAHGVRVWLKQHPESKRLVLVMDQFEELFTSCREAVRRDFVAQLIRLLDGYLPVTLILLMRDEFYNRFAQQEELMEWLERSRGPINVPPTLKRDELSAIVREPAHTVGFRFEEGLVETIVKDALETALATEDAGPAGRSTVLPLLEFALTQLWEERQDGILTHKAYDKIGGVTGGLKQWADQAFRTLEKGQQRLATRIFTDLVYLGDESQGLPDSRRRRSLSTLYRQNEEQKDVRQVIRLLVDARLLVTTTELESGEETVEIIHDALLREWDLLRWWIEQDRRFLLWHQELERRVQAWAETSPDDPNFRDEDKLLRGRELAESEGWLTERATDLNTVEQVFIYSSRERQRREEQRWKELYEEAERQRQEAERQRDTAERQRQIALARQLAAQAQLLLDQPRSYHLLERGVLLAIESMQRFSFLEGDQTLRRGIAMLYHCLNSLSIEIPILSAGFSPDGQYLATGEGLISGYAQVWQIPTGSRLLSLFPTAPVNAVACSPDGQLLATNSGSAVRSGLVQVWEIPSGDCLLSLPLGSFMSKVGFSPDGSKVATGSSDHTAGVWEIATGHRLATLPHEDNISAVAFSPDGQFLATASWDRTAKIWDIATGESMATLSHEGTVLSITFSSDGSRVATGSADHTAGIWEIATGHRSATLPHEADVYAVAFSRDRQLLATGSGKSASIPGSVLIWEVGTGRRLAILPHEAEVYGVAFSLDGGWLTSVSEEGIARIWEIATGRRLAPLCHQDRVFAATFSSDGRWLATGSADHTAGIWEVASGCRLATLAHQPRADAAVFSPDGQLLATAQDTTLGIWEITTGHRLATMSHGIGVDAVAFSPDGSRVATGSADHTVGIWEVANGQRLATLSHEAEVYAVAFSPDGQVLATASKDHTAGIWEVASGCRLATLDHEAEVYAVAFSPDGSRVATTSVDYTAGIWEVASGCRLATLSHQGIVWKIVFSPDGSRVATASTDKTAGVWEVATEHRLASLSHEDDVWNIAFSPDGSRVATASKDGMAGIWEIATGHRLASFHHERDVLAVSFSPDGAYLASASQDGTAGVWEIATGRRLAILPHEDRLSTVAFSPDGKYLATASWDKTARLWLWRPEDLIAEAQNRLTRNLTIEEWQQYIGEEPYHKTCPYLP